MGWKGGFDSSCLPSLGNSKWSCYPLGRDLSSGILAGAISELVAEVEESISHSISTIERPIMENDRIVISAKRGEILLSPT